MTARFVVLRWRRRIKVKSRQPLEIEPRIPGFSPHNRLHILHSLNIRRPLSTCRQNSIRGQPENSLHQERTHAKCLEHLASENDWLPGVETEASKQQTCWLHFPAEARCSKECVYTLILIMMCRHILQVVLLTIHGIHYYCHWSLPCGGCFEGGLDGTGSGIESSAATDWYRINLCHAEYAYTEKCRMTTKCKLIYRNWSVIEYIIVLQHN